MNAKQRRRILRQRAARAALVRAKGLTPPGWALAREGWRPVVNGELQGTPLETATERMARIERMMPREEPRSTLDVIATAAALLLLAGAVAFLTLWMPSSCGVGM